MQRFLMATVALALLTATVTSPADAGQARPYRWSPARWAQIMPTAAQLPAGLRGDRERFQGHIYPFTSGVGLDCPNRENQCSTPSWYVPANTLGWGNLDLVTANHFIDGARTWLVGPFQGTVIPASTPQIWIALGLFPQVEQAREVARALQPTYPSMIAGETVEYRTDLGTPSPVFNSQVPPAAQGTAQVLSAPGAAPTTTIHFLNFARGSIVVEIWGRSVDPSVLLGLGRIIDTNLVAAGEK